MSEHKQNKSKLHEKGKKIQQFSSYYIFDIFIIMSLTFDVVFK